MAWSPHEDVLAVVGKDLLVYITFNGNKADRKVGSIKGGGKTVSHSSVTFIPDPKYKDDMISGGSDGQLYLWQGPSSSKQQPNTPKGAVTSVIC